MSHEQCGCSYRRAESTEKEGKRSVRRRSRRRRRRRRRTRRRRFQRRVECLF
jgi:hypothetical protein